MSDQKSSAFASSTMPMSRQKTAYAWLSNYQNGPNMPVCLMIIGIKDLKQINERHGRGGGDALIRKVGNSIRDFANGKIKGLKMVARLPGREFLLVIEGENIMFERHASALLDILSADFGSKGKALHISARIGIAAAQEGEKGADLLHRAGTALSRAYNRKGKRFIVAENNSQERMQLTATLDADLRMAIENCDISIMLQPQFAVNNGQLVGAEALARWNHGIYGEVGADALFAAADRCDLREELSHLIQQQAIAIAASWPVALDSLRLSVNLGAEELTEDYSERLLALLEETGFPAARLTLELTEESLVRDAKLAAAQLDQLRAHGIRIAVDDFGTGYSSLAYLKDLPLDYLKIDKGMTPDISGTSRDRIVLRAIIAMAKALGLMIIAEGVEKEEELDMLKAEECDYFQGYLRSQPLSADGFERFALRSD